MELKWKKVCPTDRTILDVLNRNYAGNPKELISGPQVIPPSKIKNLVRLASGLFNNLHQEILIVGDYDVDGITSTAILELLLQYLGASVKHHLPRRFSEGYGVSTKMLERSNAQVILTVDNGISATEAVEYAKSQGKTVYILDHHTPKDVLPPADIIVDPHISPNENGFVEYCGAGLALKLAEEMLADDPDAAGLLKTMTVFAAIGTIGDVMPLVGDNRRIVQQGLEIIRKEKKYLTEGLRATILASGMYAVTEMDIAFKLAPMLNAPGRMHDNGAEASLKQLLEANSYIAKQGAENLALVNERRKTSVEEALILCEKAIADDCLYGDVPLCVYLPGVNEGIVGIVTGKLAEKYKIPAFVFTDSEESGVLKGSGRSTDDVSLIDVVEAASKHLIRYGGHAGAAGLSVKKENFAAMSLKMQEYLSGYEPKSVDQVYYDLEIDAESVPAVMKELMKYAPYGQGNPAPVFCVKNITLSPRYGSHFKVMGKNASHLKLFANGFSMIAFDGAERFHQESDPMRVSVIGTISENVFQYAKETQIEVKDWQSVANNGVQSSLLDALRANGTL